MGKAAKRRKKELAKVTKRWEPDFEQVYCPLCRRDDQLVDIEDEPMIECYRCDIQFFFEERNDPLEEDDDGGKSAAASAKVFAEAAVEHARRNHLEQCHPTPGKMVEL